LPKPCSWQEYRPTEANIAAINKLVTRESNWDPNITITLIQMRAPGHPSTGLDADDSSTFKAYALDGFQHESTIPSLIWSPASATPKRATAKDMAPAPASA